MASDAADKLAYRALTDDSVETKRSDLQISVTVDKENRLLTVSDNGIGMDREALESNLGTIAHSGSLQFKREMEERGDTDIIGQFGVGFYAAFMVADRVTVLSRAYGSQEAWRWESDGADGYTVTAAEKAEPGTDVILHIKEDGEEEQYSQFLETQRLRGLIKKYSDYIRYPIRMEVEESRMKEKPEGAGEDYTPEWETVREVKTLNSMVPLWQRRKAERSEGAHV